MSSKLYDALVRTGRTFVQGALAIGTLSATTGVNADLPHVLIGAAYAGGFAVLMAFAFPAKAAPSDAPSE
jgi:hypothetical protein